ncbi:MAG: oligosaccharide flippase family protein [Kiritimatiellae bacterium]|nr:oligosaccharide flippase family protein [Kiritimatiellia bacterium]
MKLDVARNARRNVAASTVLNVVKTVLPFVNRTLFLWFMGVEYLGLNGLFASVLSVLSLAEMGFTDAVVSSLYKPIAQDDRALVRAYLAHFRRIYRCIGTGVFLAGLCIAPFVGAAVKGDVPPDVDLRVLFLVHLANTVSSYFVYAYRGPILGAHQRTDVAVNIRTALLLLQYAVLAPVVVFVRNYYLYVCTVVAFTVAGNVLTMVAAKRLFPWAVPGGALSPERRRKLLSDVKAIMMHKLGGILTVQSNGLVLSAFLGLGAVAVFGNYNYVVVAAMGFVSAFNGSMAGGFGNRLHTEGEARTFATLLKANRMTMAVVSWASAMMLALYQPFMSAWTKGDPALVRHFATPLLFVAWFALHESRSMLLSFKSAAAIWRADRWKAIAGGAADLSLNVALVLCLPDGWKMDGVVISTLVVLSLVQIPWETRVVFARHFGRAGLRRFLRQQLSFLAFAAALCAATLCAVAPVPGDGWSGLFAKGAVAAAVSGAAVLVLFGRELAACMVPRLAGKTGR